MKLLDMPKLSEMSNLLTEFDLGDRVFNGQLDAYSCKKAGQDKRLSFQLEAKLVEQLSVSPTTARSPLGSLSKQSTRKLIITLISTMNASFPDYDFSNVKPSQFDVEPNGFQAVEQINNSLVDPIEKVRPGFKADFWKAIDDAVKIDECEIYRFLPDVESEDLLLNKLWSFYYFFFNKKEKKVVLLHCSEKSQLHKTRSLLSQEDDFKMTSASPAPSPTPVA